MINDPDNNSPNCTIQEIEGNLFECDPNDALAHCVSADLVMGRGIAVEFKNRFGNIDKLKKQSPNVGKSLSLFCENRFIFYLVTKQKYFQKPTMETLKETLIDMRKQMKALNIQNLSMPRIGCGLDRLSWPNCLNLIKNVFEKDNVIITIYHI